jgi:hypothetical protein
LKIKKIKTKKTIVFLQRNLTVIYIYIPIVIEFKDIQSKMPRYYDSDDLEEVGDHYSESGDSYSEDGNCCSETEDSFSEDGYISSEDGYIFSEDEHYQQVPISVPVLSAGKRRTHGTHPMQHNQKRHRMQHSSNSQRMQQDFRVSANHTKKPQSGVYVLNNPQTNVCYVGKSDNIENRILQHKEENKTTLLIREQTITTGTNNDLESWERNEVLTRMYRQGMESVRGWKYTRRGALTMEEKLSARNDIMEKFDLCRRCGHNNHFVDKCFARSPAFWCKDIPMF